MDIAAHLQTATTAGALAASGISGDGSDVLNSANLKTSTSQGSEGRLGARTGGLGALATSGTQLDVDGGDTELLDTGSAIVSGQHCGVRGSLITISLHLHTTGGTAQSLSAGQISNVLQIIKYRFNKIIFTLNQTEIPILTILITYHKGVVERSENVSNSEVLLAISGLGGEGDLLNRFLSFCAL